MTALVPVAHARQTLAKGSRSFAFAARFLTEEQWDDAARVYAFCRTVDDIADDESVPVEARRIALRDLRLQVRRALDPCPDVAGLLDVDRRCGLSLNAAVALIDGCESDLGGVRMGTDQDLLRYCYRVASTVGLLMCGVLGVRDRAARAFAIDLGIAMQLTNICRDVLEDAGNNRVYLPAERLIARGVLPEDLLLGEADPHAVSSVVLDLLDLADAYYASALRGMRYLPWRARLAILVAARVYRRIGTVLRHRHGNALLGRVVVPFSGKVLEATRAVALWFRPDVLGLTAPASHDPNLHVALSGLPHANAPRLPMTAGERVFA